jgi:hypothetical protein
LKLKEFDTVLLKDSRTGDIMDIQGEGEDITIDIKLDGDDWETDYITKDDIEKVIHSSEK